MKQASLFDEIAPESSPVERLKALAPVARALVAGALANKLIQSYFVDPYLKQVWTPERQQRCPTVRVEYEDTRVIGTIGEGLAIGASKRWGEVEGVFPLDPDDPVHPTRMLYLYKEFNPYQKRFDQRRSMRRRLPGPLVTRALRSTRTAFLAGLSVEDIVAIRDRLKTDPITFWRAAKGKPFTPPAHACLFGSDS